MYMTIIYLKVLQYVSKHEVVREYIPLSKNSAFVSNTFLPSVIL